MVRPKRYCIYCGAELPLSLQLYKRKYCGFTCRNKHKLRIRKPEVVEKLWQHERSVFEAALELHWEGEESAAIARTLNIPVGTVYSWVHDFGGQRRRKEPLKKLLRAAASAEEWLCALRGGANGDGSGCDGGATFNDLTVSLVCGKWRGQSADRLTTHIYEGLKEDLLNEKRYAFCNLGGNVITTIAFIAPVFSISKYVKTSGTYIWPGEELGKSIVVTEAEFERLVFLKKREKVCEKVQKRLTLCGFGGILKT